MFCVVAEIMLLWLLRRHFELCGLVWSAVAGKLSPLIGMPTNLWDMGSRWNFRDTLHVCWDVTIFAYCCTMSQIFCRHFGKQTWLSRNVLYAFCRSIISRKSHQIAWLYLERFPSYTQYNGRRDNPLEYRTLILDLLLGNRHYPFLLKANTWAKVHAPGVQQH